MDLDVGWGAALLAGLLSFVSPCVLPLVPPYLAYLAGTTIREITDENAASGVTRRVFLQALIFVFGFSTVFVGLGASASYFGSLITEYLDVLGTIAGIVILLLGLHFLGILPIGLLLREARFQELRRCSGHPGTSGFPRSSRDRCIRDRGDSR